MNVDAIMTSPVATITEDSTVEQAARLMVDKSTSCLPVLDRSGELVGIITHTDFGFHRRFLPMSDHLYTLMGSWVQPETLVKVASEDSKKTVKEVMSKPVVTVNTDDEVKRVAELMLSENINRIPVLKNGKLVGIVTRHDFVKLMIS